MRTLEKLQQRRQVLELLKGFMQKGAELRMIAEGVNYEEKIVHVIKTQEKLKVVLVGGFSEGKTSIAAAWLENLDKSRMKIAHEESSSEVEHYDVDGCVELVDTPGLFGFKEKCDGDTHNTQKYKDITQKYVSEAHLVLYIMDSNHPIRKSHKEELYWLFKELELLPRSVFVLSRFDEVADITDERDYQYYLEAKQKDVRRGLQRAIGLDEAQAKALCIVAVAANPFDKGIEYWLENLEEFRRYSHIALLQEATDATIKANGEVDGLIQQSQKSVLVDLLHPCLKKGRVAIEDLQKEFSGLQEAHQRMSSELEKFECSVGVIKEDLQAHFADHFARLLENLEEAGLNNMKEFLERWIGEEGRELNGVIEEAFKQAVELVHISLEEVDNRFQKEWTGSSWTHFSWDNSEFEKILNMLKNVFGSAAFAGLFASFTETLVGVFNLGSKATNFIKGASGVLAALTIILEFVALLAQERAKSELEVFKKDLTLKLNTIKEEVFGIIEQWYAQGLKTCENLQQEIVKLEPKLESLKMRSEVLESWVKHGEDIKAQMDALS
ncbi:LeoA/HP0731 family dynamin-like GTPase [Helicobacter cynogastricus]|uniref:LeoA/HP0731 family dynamin-like GTPase n=1 Tax=Helicobacter cynogastricus TaxID=329937 RepID=UPI000CF10518|nr:LeoA/HP0731 family dynamin-like GTPase [Helicobacter cynogastricus]